jgi:diguanylate cyclase (GGDEF)-like protein
MMLMFFLLVFWMLGQADSPALSDRMFSDAAETFSAGWTTEDGTEVDLSMLQNLEGTHAGETFSVYHTIPDTLEEGDSVCFRSKNIFFSVYIDGVCVYEPDVPESIFYTNSLGTRWSCIPISISQRGGQLEIRITKAYETARACIDNLYLGNSGGMILYVIRERLPAFVTCLLLLFVALILIVADIPVNMQVQKNHELLYLGLFSLFVAIWCLSETNLIQLYYDNSRVIQVVSCFSLMMIPIPIALYAEASIGFHFRWVVPVACILSGLNLFISWELHLLGMYDIHETLFLTHILLVLSALLMFYALVRDAFQKRKKRFANIYHVLKTVGMSCICVAAAVDIIRFYRGSSDDSAMFVRIGLLIFIICYGVSSLENTVRAVKRGAQSELVRKLAYQDGLTGIGNRTAFKEKIDALDHQQLETASVGIVMFDVNDLKFVNDHLGHAMGDEMITQSAKVISQSFAPYQGNCYRIGGDEFAVILMGEQVQQRYEAAIAQFHARIAAYNADAKKPFYLSIAHGYAEYQHTTLPTQTVTSAYRQADANMYENKKKMKAQTDTKDLYASVL